MTIIDMRHRSDHNCGYCH